jgi:hypothetical protein
MVSKLLVRSELRRGFGQSWMSGPKNIYLREFSYADRAMYESMTDEQRKADENLPSETQGCPTGGQSA